MPFQPDVDQELVIDRIAYRVTEHPDVPGSGIPYGQEGRAGIVYQLIDDAGNYRALKVFKPAYRQPSLVGLTRKLETYADLPGLSVCRRMVLTPQVHGELLREHPDLLYGAFMPWIEGRTWSEILQSGEPLSPEQSLTLAQVFTAVLAQLEQEGVAHGDLSGSNLLIEGLDTGTPRVELVDVEQLYAPGLSHPTNLPKGSPGYTHKKSGEFMWGAEMDRFSGALLLAEILGWHDAQVREAAEGETYFPEDELQEEGERYQLLHNVLTERWGDKVAVLFEQTWKSTAMDRCPPFGAWQIALPAISRYQNALGLHEPGIILSQEIPRVTAEDETKSGKDKRWAWLWLSMLLLVMLVVGSVYLIIRRPPTTTTPAIPSMTAAGGEGGTVTGTSTHTPTWVPILIVASTLVTPSPTITDTRTLIITPMITSTNTPTATPPDTPTATATRALPESTLTQAPPAAPVITAPPHGVYQNPLNFSWSSQSGTTYQITLRNTDLGITRQSDWLSGGSWSINIPAEHFGNWEWYVVDNFGQRSTNGTFVFDPHVEGTVGLYDLNGDCRIDDLDLSIIANWNNGCSVGDICYSDRVDFNNNGIIDDEDVAQIGSRMGRTVPNCTP